VGETTGISWTDRLQRAANQAVHLEVSAGIRPHANEIHCSDCGHIHFAGERRHEWHHHLGYAALTLTDFPIWPRWIIFGGESGSGRRECEAEWARQIRFEINEYLPGMVAFFVKQMSARTPAEGKALIPPDLMIQEFPA